MTDAALYDRIRFIVPLEGEPILEAFLKAEGVAEGAAG
jgi:hypothetical protein